jgi:hypothetical protein
VRSRFFKSVFWAEGKQKYALLRIATSTCEFGDFEWI